MLAFVNGGCAETLEPDLSREVCPAASQGLGQASESELLSLVLR